MTINVANFDRTGATDNADKLKAIAQEIDSLWKAGKPLPRILFPEGVYKFSSWPDLAYDHLEIVAEGEVRLMGDISFNGWLRKPNASETGIENFRFEGFHIYGSARFAAVHRSNIQVRIIGAGIAMIFCVATVIQPQVSDNTHATGLYIDAWPGKPNLQTTACAIVNPILEGCAVGLDMRSAASCTVYSGTIESCNLGVHLGAASGNNMFYSVEMEGNGQDVLAEPKSHKNGFLYCGSGSKLNTNFGRFLLSSNWAQH